MFLITLNPAELHPSRYGMKHDYHCNDIIMIIICFDTASSHWLKRG